MKLRELWDNYDYYTSELSKTFRTLAVSGAAIAWFFKSENFSFPNFILLSLVFLVAFFIADIIQYFVAAIRIKKYARSKEKEMYKKKIEYNSETEIEVPEWLDNWPFTLFCIKSGLILAAYIFILIEISTRILC